MNLLNFLRPKIRPINGVLEDSRLPEEKQKDYRTEEILPMVAPPNYRPWDDWRTDPKNIKRLNDIKVKNQNGVGSCFPGNTPILTQDFTYKPISEIDTGELVFTHNGQLHPVLNIFKRKWQGTMREIRLWGDFRPITATREHPFYAIKRSYVNKRAEKKEIKGNPDFYPIIDLKKGDWVGMPFNNIIRDTTIYNFEKDPDFLWVLGLYLAEGSLDNKQIKGNRIIFSLSENEIHFYEKIKSTMSKYGVIVNYSFKPKNHGLRASFSSKCWVNIFKELASEYSNKKEIHKRLMFINPELQMNIVRGFIDGDGWQQKNRTLMVSTSYNLMVQLKTILLRNKIYASFYTKYQKDRKPAWVLEFSGNSRYSFIKDNWCFVLIKSTKDIRAYAGGNVYNLEVDNDNSYLVNGVAVHNCAAQAGATHLEINNYLEDGKYTELSARSIYGNRRNKPQVGTYMDDLGNILVKRGAIPEVFCPSPNDTEAHMSDVSDVISLYEGFGKVTRAGSYIWLTGKNIDDYARISTLDLPIAFTVKFGEHEWGNELCPQLRDIDLPYGHCNDFFPSGTVMYQGKKGLVDQDSWDKYVGYGGRRIITEDWFTAGRILFGIWTVDLNNLAIFNQQVVEQKPHYHFTRELEVGMRGKDVAMLQVCLATLQDADGFLFPLWQGQEPTGYYGGITRNAVQRFQTLYGINPVGRVGPETLAKLNEVFV